MSLTITALRTEYSTNPLGIDEREPRLSYVLSADRNGAAQVARRITVGLRPGTSDKWDSGRVESPDTAHIPYQGSPLEPGERVFWQVTVWDERGETSDSDVAFWEQGLGAWDHSHWVGAALVGGPRTTAPVGYFRTAFSLPSPPVSARLYITALGLYEPYLNGERIGLDEFAPGWTDYRKRVQYRAYDVTESLKRGDNVLGSILGDGWYCGHIEWRDRQMYGDRPLLRAELHIHFADGTKQVIGTDSTWQVGSGPILESDIIMGEAVDARREVPGWNRDSTAPPGFAPAIQHDAQVKIVAAAGPPVRVTEEIHPTADPIRRPTWPRDQWIIDLGQNMVGRVRLRVSGKCGDTIRLRYAEMLDEKGNLYLAALRSARATDYYTLKGDGEEVYESKFTFHGFRYVEVTNLESPPNSDTITGIVLHSDTPITGTFSCSEPLLNQLQKNIQWGQRGNFLDVPTDCPQRDERLGWTGDAQVFGATAAFNADVAGFFTKWQTDLRDAQGEDGAIPPVIPNTGVVGGDGGPAWADAVIICPWQMYQAYGDQRLLERNYDVFKKYLDYLQSTAIDLIRSHPDWNGFSGFGDWLSTNAETPNDLIGTAFFAHSADLLSQIAGVLRKSQDEATYAELKSRVARAFRNRFLTPDGLITSQTQTAYVLALHFGLLEEHQEAGVLELLTKNIAKRGDHLSTGFVGTPYLTHVLSDYGQEDVAFRLLMQKTYPSWLYPVTQGATTIWERWDGWTHDKGFQDAGMNSFNHYAYGAVGNWLYTRVAGLAPAAPGYREIAFRPLIGGGLTQATATLETILGRASSMWQVEGNELVWTIEVPVGSKGLVELPHGFESAMLEGVKHTNSFEVGSGTYRITATRKKT
jgi:alpha-L-rhamnosidase